MNVTHYQSSKGPKPIADMPLPYLTNAIEKMRRDGEHIRRPHEFNAMVSHQATLLEQEAAK